MSRMIIEPRARYDDKMTASVAAGKDGRLKLTVRTTAMAKIGVTKERPYVAVEFDPDSNEIWLAPTDEKHDCKFLIRHDGRGSASGTINFRLPGMTKGSPPAQPMTAEIAGGELRIAIGEAL